MLEKNIYKIWNNLQNFEKNEGNSTKKLKIDWFNATTISAFLITQYFEWTIVWPKLKGARRGDRIVWPRANVLKLFFVCLSPASFSSLI
jgi:hypothetical protein